MKVELERYTLAADALCGEAAAICTDYQGDPLKALDGAMGAGHESVAEHSSFTFVIEGVSRVLLAQLTRHRLASFSVQSQRYVRQSESMSVIPPSVKENKTALAAVTMHYDQAFNLYDDLIKMGIPSEDARYVLHQGICTKLMMTMNARELRHFMALRMCNRAQWEIRELADRLYQAAYHVAPKLFDNAGPGCVVGLCPEGKRSCGNPRIRDLMQMKEAEQ